MTDSAVGAWRPSARPWLRRALAAGGGFLVAVLWFDLMFDVQVLRYGSVTVLPDEVLASIAAYYRRVTTDASPMNHLITTVMLFVLGGSVYQLVRSGARRWREAITLLSCAGPIGLAAARVVPDAVQLGTRADSLARQTELARAICIDHLICIAGIGVFVVLQLTANDAPPDGP